MSRKNVLITLGASVASAAVASGVTWVVARRILDEQYEERVNEEVKNSVAYILKQSGLNVIVSDEDPDILAEQLNEQAGLEPVDIEEITPEEAAEALKEKAAKAVKMVEDHLDEVDGERVLPGQAEKPPLEDLAARNNTVEYNKIMTVEKEEGLFPEQPEEFHEPPPENPDISVISREIFMANGTEWEQATITYFADGGVIDVNGDYVQNHEELIGEGIPRFGEQSDDANVVYVRNKKLEKEFEIISDPGNATDFLSHSLGEMYKPGYLR